MQKLYIVVLQYNKSELTLKCLESTSFLNYDNYKVIVIDNGSELEHLKTIEFWIAKRNSDKYSLITSDRNLGYGGGNNLGIKKALEDSADYVLVLNNDVILDPNFLDVLPSDDICGPFFDKIKWLVPQGLPAKYGDKNSFVCGAAMLIKRSVFKSIGLISEDYFLYFEDADFCFRAIRSGFTLGHMEPNLKHQGSGSVTSLGVQKKLLMNVRNSYKFFHKFAPSIIKLVLPIWYPMAILYARLYGHYRDRMRND